MATTGSFGTLHEIRSASGTVHTHALPELERQGALAVSRLPYSVRVLLDSLLRAEARGALRADDVLGMAGYDARAVTPREIPFYPARVILQDFTGVPAVVDLAAMRASLARLGGDPRRINPLIPVDLVIDHSVQVDAFGRGDALARNHALEFQRNGERYAFLRWGQGAFDNFRVVPPASGIVHQVNLEYLATVVATRAEGGRTIAFPDSLVGTDSHTTMINGLGVLGWGVGGIEAEAVMLGLPIDMLLPEVVAMRLHGRLPAGATATDLVLRVTELLRGRGVVGRFVEFIGPGLSALTLPDRATIANMAPEYGATVGFFPVDDETLGFLRATARPAGLVDLVERVCKTQGLFRADADPEPVYTDVLDLDLSSVEPALAGPRRPQDRVALATMKQTWRATAHAPIDKGGFGLSDEDARRAVTVQVDERGSSELGQGAVVIAAITSCTNTSNPSVMLAAGLLAKKAVEAGLSVPAHVKTSLAPGSRVVTEYLERAGLAPYLDALGFQTVGYGCTTCIGNSGPLPEAVAAAIEAQDMTVAAVLSGNRNFSGRVNPHTKANYLASPPLVVAYALAGTVDFDPREDPIGVGAAGEPVFLADLWPGSDEIAALLPLALDAPTFDRLYGDVEQSNADWNAIPAPTGVLYEWDAASTYIQEPPFLDGLTREVAPISGIEGARVLFFGGDSVTTDHISPAGSIARDSAAARYLEERGVARADWNSYGARRGNDRVMVRGTFANIRLRNRLAQGREGSWTTHQPSGELLSIYDAAARYREQGTPLVILAGRDYGMGSSRDWAAKGTALLGVKAVIAESYERIHRSNLVGMGVLPLELGDGDTMDGLGLTGDEVFSIAIDDDVRPRQNVRVRAVRPDGVTLSFHALCRLDTPGDVDLHRQGGILPKVVRDLL